MISLIINKISDCFYVPNFPFIISTYYGVPIKDSSLFYCIGNLSTIVFSIILVKFISKINEKNILIFNLILNIIEVYCLFPIRNIIK